MKDKEKEKPKDAEKRHSAKLKKQLPPASPAKKGKDHKEHKDSKDSKRSPKIEDDEEEDHKPKGKHDADEPSDDDLAEEDDIDLGDEVEEEEEELPEEEEAPPPVKAAKSKRAGKEEVLNGKKRQRPQQAGDPPGPDPRTPRIDEARNRSNPRRFGFRRRGVNRSSWDEVNIKRQAALTANNANLRE